MSKNVLQILVNHNKRHGKQHQKCDSHDRQPVGTKSSTAVGGLCKINTGRKLSCMPLSELVLSYVYISIAHKIKPVPAGYWLNTCNNGNEATKDKLENKKRISIPLLITRV